MPEIRKCRGCGADVPTNAPFGHCPKCLLDLGFGPLPADAEPPHPVKAGQDRVFGDYELVEQIGRGGMGVVYKARQLALNRLVAIKTVSAGELASPILIQRFHREAEAAANLHHPNIVPIYETGDYHGQHFFSMELIDGTGLDRHIGRAGFSIGEPEGDARSVLRARQEQIARILAKVARAVDYAHQHGVLHRDLKPSNVVMDANGEPHLTDFGVAKVLGQGDSSLTASGAIMGTPSYMAPEQAAGQSKRITTAADVYSLGAILYAMLTGSPPFRGDTPVETLRQVVEQEPKHPSTLKDGIDLDLATIGMKCLEKEPQQRYASAAALGEDLERWLRREPILARPAGTVGRLSRWCRREPVMASLAAGIVLSLVGITFAALVAFQNARIAADLAEQGRQETEATNRQLRKVGERQVKVLLGELTRFYDNPTQSVVRISSEELALLTGRLPAESIPGQTPFRLVFGVYSHTPPSGMFTRFAPALSYLETNVTEFPLQVDLVIYKGYSNLVSALVNGAVHLARPGPASYVLARRRNPSLLVPLKQAHDQQAVIDGVIFTRPGTGISTVSDLRNNSFALGDPDSTFGNFVSKAVLLDAGFHAGDLRWAHHRDHTEVVQRVIEGSFQAGAANSNVVAKAIDGGADLKFIHVMHSVSFPWVATTNLPPHVLRVITDRLLALKDPAILTSIDSDLTGFVPAAPKDFDEFDQQMNKAAQFEKP